MNRRRFFQRGDARAAPAAGLLCRAIPRIAVCALLAFAVARARPALAQIYNEQTGQVIPGAAVGERPPARSDAPMMTCSPLDSDEAG